MDYTKAVPERIRKWVPTRRSTLAPLIRGVTEDVVSLDRGDVGFVTPEHIREAAKEAIDAGHTRYAYLPELRQAISEKLWRDNGIQADPDREIIVTCGCKGILSQTFTTLVDRWDEVIVGTPGYYDYHGSMQFHHVDPVRVPLREERGFRIDPDEIAAAITPCTKIIALTTPEGPAGAVLPQADLERIAEIAQRHDVLVMSDEIYEKINFGQTPHFSIGSLPGMGERTITINGFSKGYAMTGWRVGYAVMPEHLMPAMQKVTALNTIWLNTIAQYAAIAACRGPEEPIQEMVAEYKRRMQILVDELNAIEGIRCLFPEGTYYAWANIASFGLSSDDFARHALLSDRVKVQPGTTFGEGGEGYIRVSCSQSEEEMREGLRRLKNAVATLASSGPILSLPELE